jgi:LacI family transcriptional regulator
MNRKQNKKVGIKDIATLAGVSIGTIDRVLNNRGEVSDDTQKKVLKIAKDLGYTPNIFAKSLSSKKTTKIAIVIPDASDKNPYWEKPVKGIKLASEELVHYNTTILYKHFDASDEKSFRKVLQNVTEQQPDGIVLNPVFENTSLEFIKIFDAHNIPYVFIDVDLAGVNNLAYFGQDAALSGKVAAKLMDLSTKGNPKVLVLKLAKNKVFSQHIELRIKGFNAYFEEKLNKSGIRFTTIEIDIDAPQEPAASLDKLFTAEVSFDGIFVPNSRGFKLGEYFDAHKTKVPITIGYDLVEHNVTHLKKGNLTYLISQKPEEQAYKAIWALFNNLVSKKEVNKTNYSSIDIIIKENYDYYNENK